MLKSAGTPLILTENLISSPAVIPPNKPVTPPSAYRNFVHLRNHKCVPAIKSKTPSIFCPVPLRVPEISSNNKDYCYMKEEVKKQISLSSEMTTSTTICIVNQASALEKFTTSPPTYRVLSPPPPSHQIKQGHCKTSISQPPKSIALDLTPKVLQL